MSAFSIVQDTGCVNSESSRFYPGFDPAKVSKFAAALNNLKCILFDQDGVILDDRHLLDICVRSLLLLDVAIGQEEIIIKGKLRAPHSEIQANIQYLAGLKGKEVTLDEVNAAIGISKAEITNQNSGKLPELLYLSRTDISSLKTSYRLGLVTSRPRADVDGILKQFQLEDTFETLITRESVRIPKPNPEGLLLAIAEMSITSAANLSPDQCVYIGDMHTDMKAALAADISAIGVIAPMDRPAKAEAAKVLYESGATLVLDHPAHFKDIRIIVNEALGL